MMMIGYQSGRQLIYQGLSKGARIATSVAQCYNAAPRNWPALGRVAQLVRAHGSHP